MEGDIESAVQPIPINELQIVVQSSQPHNFQIQCIYCGWPNAHAQRRQHIPNNIRLQPKGIAQCKALSFFLMILGRYQVCAWYPLGVTGKRNTLGFLMLCRPICKYTIKTTSRALHFQILLLMRWLILIAPLDQLKMILLLDLFP